MNMALELHDSKVGAVGQSGANVIVRFAPAYVHSSAGRPGVDAGSGFVQEIDLVINQAIILSTVDEFPQELVDGEISLSSVIQKNLILLPLDFLGAVSFSALTMTGGTVAIKGMGAKAIMLGEPKFVERFSPAEQA